MKNDKIEHAEYWVNRYQQAQTGWDTGSITTPIKNYVDQLEDKSLRILIPGCGQGHEARYLYEQGFHNTWVCDWAAEPLQYLQKAVPQFPKRQLLQADFFALDLSPFDLIIEQTFFCALPPVRRPDYARKMRELLHHSGKLVGLLFDFPLSDQGPPFGGSKEEYLGYFEPHFEQISMEPCYNSIKPRKGSELFIQIS